MDSFKNTFIALLYKPFEALVDGAEYIYTLHSTKSHRILFIIVVIGTSLVSIVAMTGNLKMPSISFPQNFVSTSYTDDLYDPLQLLSDIRFQKDVTIVDVRSKNDYDLGHIKGAISIPLQKNDFEYPSTEDIDNTVKAVRKKFKKKNIVLYGNFQGNIYVHKFAQRLRKKGIHASSLAIGWNEWYHFRNLWLPESQWNTVDMDSYVQINLPDTP